MGVVEEICVAQAAGAAMEPRSSAAAHRGAGLEGDRYASRAGFWQDDRVSRDLTLIEGEVVEDLAATAGVALAACDARRNVVKRGIDLNRLVGQTFWIGEVLCAGTELCEPCRHLEEVTGLSLLRPLVHRGGLRARLLGSGTIAVGDTVRPVPAQEGIGVVVTKGRSVLLGRRLSSKTVAWRWYDGSRLPRPLFAPVASFVAGYDLA